MELIRKSGLSEIQQVRVSGGGARSQFWRQILSDVMDVELVTVNTTEGAAFGAALLAGVGAGLWGSVEEACQAVIHTEQSTRPDPGAVKTYAQSYPLFQGLYPALKSTFDAAGSIA
jgi:xylulokinase